MRFMRQASVCVLVVVTGAAGCGDSNTAPRDAGLGDAPAASRCPAPTAGATTHKDTIAADETWTAASGPHVLSAAVTIAAGVTVTVEPCAELRLGSKVTMIVDGTLRARGVAGRRITIHRDVAGERFGTLWVRAPGFADLAYVDIEGGGGDSGQDYGATLRVDGKDWPPAKPLRVENVSISDSAGLGAVLRVWAAFADGSSGLTIRGAGATLSDYPFPLRMSLNTVGSVPSGSYTGNAVDAIQLIGESPHYQVEQDDTLRARGVPYRMGGNGAFGELTVAGANDKLATLTVEAGVTLEHTSTSSNIGGLFIGTTGGTTPLARLVAVGTAAAPITFTGAGPGATVVAGSWEGITFVGPIAVDNRLEHVVIDAAGGHGGDRGHGCPPGGGAIDTDGALKLFTEPPQAFLRDSKISRSVSNGVFRAWTGGEVDFLPTNTFENVAGCKQVLPKPPSGSCPTNPACP